MFLQMKALKLLDDARNRGGARHPGERSSRNGEVSPMLAVDLRHSARLLRTLGNAEFARLSNDLETVTRTLDSVDPLEAYGLAAQLDAEAAIRSCSSSGSGSERRRRLSRKEW